MGNITTDKTSQEENENREEPIESKEKPIEKQLLSNIKTNDFMCLINSNPFFYFQIKYNGLSKIKDKEISTKLRSDKPKKKIKKNSKKIQTDISNSDYEQQLNQMVKRKGKQSRLVINQKRIKA